MKDNILDIQHISKSFYTKTSGSNFVLKDFNLTIKRNKITALIGGNGTGKTTLFNIISRLTEVDKLTDSSIYFEGNNLLKLNDYQIASLGIGRLFQDAHIFNNLTILENLLQGDQNKFGENAFETLLFPKKNKKIADERKEKARTILLDLFGEESIFVQQQDTLAKNLSYGQQRLLSLARLLMGDYKLVLLDEPTAGVNPKLNTKIAEIMLLLKKQGKTIFFIEHNMPFIKKTADWVAFLTDNTVLLEDTPNNVLNNKTVRNNYLGV